MLLRLSRADNVKGWEEGTFLEARPDSHKYTEHEKKIYNIIKIPDKDFKLLNLERLKHKLDTSAGIVKHPTGSKQHPVEVEIDDDLL